MRPDEHKKKRSAQYNKKKGNKGAKPENKGAEGVGRENPKSRPAQDERQQQQHTPARNVPNQNSATSSSDEEHNISSHRKTFKRREIVSNWNRYEVTDTESVGEKSVPTAVDYAKLLNVTGNASSHFRFKHEADWEEELSSFHGNQNPITHVLGIDCANLGSSLQCLPLFERLGLSADLFPAEQRELLKQDATKHRQQYSKIREQTCKSGELTPTGQTLWVDNESTVEEENDGQIHRKLNELSASLIGHEDKQLSGNQIRDPKPKEQNQHTETKNLGDNGLGNVSGADRRGDDTLTKDKGADQVEVSARLEEELDILLSMDSALASVTLQSVESTESVAKNTEDVYKKEQKSPNAGKMSVPKEDKDEEPGMTSEKDNLEDWLDSILDD
ncbi:cell death regulator Aven-like [Liolophura sinensis]|uniref:cell death regulator Aven-like n=1 Tax=Liolophura sinensis TaxID=3198878 RepID=UPI003158257B